MEWHVPNAATTDAPDTLQQGGKLGGKAPRTLASEGAARHAASSQVRAEAAAGRARLYDIAELLLAELMPGWDDEDLDHDDEDDGDLSEDSDDDLEVVDPVVDASYLACMMEAERFLVQCEGFDATGSVVVGLREHLQLARAHAAAAAPAQPRHRPPGYP